MSAIALPRIEGKYEILEKIREGGMGAIYKVRHRLLDEVRVVKVMRPQFVDDEELKARFLREARVAIKLRHPNVAELYDFTLDADGTAFIVMEFISGLTLEELLRRAGPPPLALTLEIAQQTLRALAYLHSKGFVHRDISPDNLMLTEDSDGEPRVKLIDLGIAKILGGGGSTEGHLTEVGTFLGKVHYSAPEQFGAAGAAPMDGRSDLYSFGIVLYELLTGRYPIEGRDPSSIIAGHLFRPPLDFNASDPRGQIPAGLRAAVLRALAKEPAARFTAAAEFARELALLRTAGDLLHADWKGVLAGGGGAAAQEEAPTLIDPGSTQGRLDLQFGLGTTPPPTGTSSQARSPTVPWAPAEPGAASEAPEEPELAAALLAIEAELGRGNYRGAEAQLYAVEAAFGDRPALTRLYASLADLRAQDLASRLAALLAAARGNIAAGELDAAGVELERAERLAPRDGAVGGLRAELAAATQRRAEERAAAERRESEPVAEKSHTLQAQVDERLRDGRERAAAGDWKGALRSLRRARQLAPDNGEVRDLALQAETEVRQRAEQRRHAGRIERAAAAILKRLDKGDLSEAAERLLAASSRLGAAAAWDELQSRLDAAMATLLESVRRLLAGRDLAAALRELERGGGIDSANPEVALLTGEAELAVRRQAAAAARAGELAQTVAAIGELLDRGELDKAGAELDLAVIRHGGVAPLFSQWERRERLLLARRAARSGPSTSTLPAALGAELEEDARQRLQARAEALVAQAEILLKVGDFPEGMRKLRNALALQAGHARAATLLQQAQEALARRGPPGQRQG
ncbi:MAG TPA: serine/threonine-protein kinase [Thermoanaerobaculia bacterium]|nr:serine/threonine-protein kinase [Thermoanaerobaculia bacterium]